MLKRLTNAVAGLLSTALIMTAAACGTTSSTASSTTPVTVDHGHVALFTPSTEFTLATSVPLNRWNQFVPAVTNALVSQGFTKKNIMSTTSSTLEEQSHTIQDYVVQQVGNNQDEPYADAQNESHATTIMVAPAVHRDQTMLAYGDLVSQPLPDQRDTDDASAWSRLASALTLAKHAGMHVVVLSDMIPEFTPDAYIQFADAAAIGRMQARQMINKLAMNSVSKDNPKYVEILLPLGTDPTNADETTDPTALFNQQAFTGMWEELRPYFLNGTMRSVSGTLTSQTTNEDWKDVSFKATKPDMVQHELQRRLEADGDDDHLAAIDGVIAMNDYVANNVVAELGALDYVGSAADINPSIDILSIVSNITGKKDLERAQVPDAQQAPTVPQSDHGDHASRPVVKSSDAWPLVTGFGAYVSNMQDIVNGKQWLTGFEDRNVFADKAAIICNTLNADQSLSTLNFLSVQGEGAMRTSILSWPVTVVYAGNLKRELIDPGYISLADAGL
ncbi:hypothetical protein BIFGAL_03238 [Bifidobacterium gallicum DSM 20093 = LMG 11596]|uniref:Periplasmic binding protein domain-containing protein n=1 Tax=Bifidobacterium gallicum DSM 20093 = LMG 11596 TaxID=561180 RepID=D1NTS2_9BIFI|nr:hypothetical protein BIFGAL_03238 [Bifidobacterium gallicum DSM 20093 = LMG 11596]